MEQLAALCEPSAQTVDAIWGSTWADGAGQQTRLVVAGDIQALAGLLKRENTDGLAKTAAVTVGPKHSPADAVYINGPAFVELSDLGREVVLTHELVHVASRATGDWDAPTWLEEASPTTWPIATPISPRVRSLRLLLMPPATSSSN